MFETKAEVGAAVDAVYALLVVLKRGQILTHMSISAALSLRPHEGSWDHVVGRARSRLQKEHGIATWPEPGVGYKLCTQEEQLQIPAWRAARAVRQARKARHSVEALPEKGLSMHQRRVRLAMIERATNTEKSLRRETKEMSAIFGARYQTPRRSPEASVPPPATISARGA